MKKQVLIVGGGEVGGSLAGLLLDWGHSTVLLELREDAVALWQGRLPGARVLQGDGTDPEALEAAGIRETDILAAVTRSDQVNLTVASLARFEFEVGRTVARVNVPRHAWMFTSGMGVDVALNQAEVLAHLIVEEAGGGSSAQSDELT